MLSSYGLANQLYNIGGYAWLVLIARTDDCMLALFLLSSLYTSLFVARRLRFAIKLEPNDFEDVIVVHPEIIVRRTAYHWRPL